MSTGEYNTVSTTRMSCADKDDRVWVYAKVQILATGRSRFDTGDLGLFYTMLIFDRFDNSSSSGNEQMPGGSNDRPVLDDHPRRRDDDDDCDRDALDGPIDMSAGRLINR